MAKPSEALVAIVDYGMGNLFSVKQACEHVGLRVIISTSPQAVQKADAILLPGVGAFSNAMEALTKLDMIEPLREAAQSSKPLLGICLGMQLLMNRSNEFGSHDGLGIIQGEVVSLGSAESSPHQMKVPQVGWNQIHQVDNTSLTREAGISNHSWNEPLLHGLINGEYMYFVHSYYAIPVDDNGIVSTTKYGDIEFCSSYRFGNVFACQFHPERSGPAGLQIYRNLAMSLTESTRVAAV